MKEKQKELLTILLAQDRPISSKILSEKLNISVRTVKSYIYELNNSAPVPAISSSNRGYKVNAKQVNQLLQNEEQKNKIPQNYQDRAFFIIKSILINHQPLELFDLAEKLFVSYSTLKNDIAQMNKTFEKFHVNFVVKKSLVQINGSEEEKRRLISYIVFEEIPSHILDSDVLKKNFAEEDVTKLSAIIQSVVHESAYSLNDFSFMNLMLHLLILIEEVKNGKTLVTRKGFSSWLRKDKAKLVTEIIQKIESGFQLSLNRLEKEEIHMIFQANANYIPSNNLQELDQVVEKPILEAITIVFKDVIQTFGIELSSESFLIPFVLHISGLFSRAKQRSTLKNPMLQAIRQDYPIVYDIAVFISLKLSSLLEVQISEDECAYIALHVGTELEDQKKNVSKIKTVLLCPKYMNLDEKLYTQLNQEFGNEIHIVKLVSSIAEIENISFELLISTLAVDSSNRYSLIQIPPILNEQSRLTLVNELAAIRSKRKEKILIKYFDDYFDVDFFSIETAPVDKKNILKNMCSQLIAADVVQPEFYQHVLEREQAASTAFESIAIPHSVYMDAKKTIISVCLSKRGIIWGNQKVNMVLLTAINDVDRKIFTDIYEALISIFDQSSFFEKFTSINSYQDFRELIIAKSVE